MKNPPGYGSIVNLGKGRRKPIAVRIPNGKKFNKNGIEVTNYKYLGYFTKEDKDKALKLLSDYNSGIATSMPIAATCPTFKEMADIWIEKHIKHIEARKGAVSVQLVHSYNAAIKKCESIHTKPINRVKFQDVQDIADSISDMSMSTVSNTKTALYETFDLARKQKYITENFINDIDFLYKQKEDKIHSSFTRGEVSKLWENKDNANAQIILIMIYTGLRIEEFLSMQTCDVHLREKYMIGGVKTLSGKNRIIPIADKIYPYVCGIYNKDNSYLFNNGGKRCCRSVFMDSVWNPTMEQLGMNHLPHDTRYTCATLMDRAGVNDNCKKTILGHAKQGVTNKIYVEKDLQDLLDAINMI